MLHVFKIKIENDKDDIPEMSTSCDIPTNCLYIADVVFFIVGQTFNYFQSSCADKAM